MKTEKRNRLVAPCGIDCGICELYVCRDNQPLMDYLISIGIPREKLPCEGCREIEGCCPAIGGLCETYQCIKKKNVEFCFQCGDFPCEKLNPSADRADVLPHNLKVFNLCTIQRNGVEGFTAASAKIKHRYFKGKMKIGSGPQLEKDPDR